LLCHYAHFDSSITQNHFLRHNPLIWRLVNNTLHYQNRLRIADYRQLYEGANFEILSEENATVSDEAIAGIKLTDAFTSYAHKDIIVIYSKLIGKPR